MESEICLQLERMKCRNMGTQICAFPLTLFATWWGMYPVNPELTPDLSAADTHLPSLANCQGRWDGRLISWRVCITLMQLRSSAALSQLCYWGMCLCGDQGSAMPSDAWMCNSLTTTFFAICMVSAALSEHFQPCHFQQRQLSKWFAWTYTWKILTD